MKWEGDERRKHVLTEIEFEAIAERAAERALEKVYSQIGNAVLKRIAFWLGAGALALIVWLSSKGVNVK